MNGNGCAIGTFRSCSTAMHEHASWMKIEADRSRGRPTDLLGTSNVKCLDGKRLGALVVSADVGGILSPQRLDGALSILWTKPTTWFNDAQPSRGGTPAFNTHVRQLNQIGSHLNRANVAVLRRCKFFRLAPNARCDDRIFGFPSRRQLPIEATTFEALQRNFWSNRRDVLCNWLDTRVPRMNLRVGATKDAQRSKVQNGGRLWV